MNAYQAISPNFFLQNLKGRSLQLHHATADTHVPYRFSQVLAGALKQAKQPHVLFTYANDNHLSNNLILALARSVAFSSRICE
ncbi:S9 family peptidase [Deinococcus sp. QL22]|uniref:alpha/beta hydrolase family protein n=1 Tax=Deinococcus sp. QL22 TaxID=2939437 RepID=UPI002016D3DC|nr:prolyl oligopeptidase family serine peptidase [Deinococcus sp. QL22]UQN08478.1 prolyl oligopeptidase family serine peptidase [Deinococcus sp. QL22]